MKFLYGLLIAIVFVFIGTPVMAIEEPDSLPNIHAVYVYEDVLTDGDIGVLIDYELDYATLPDETAYDAYIGIFVDTDGTTQLRAIQPYAYADSGYGRGLMWMRFTPTEVAAYGLTVTNQALYRIWLTGNPTLAWTDNTSAAIDPPFTSTTIGYWQASGVTQTILGLRVLYYAEVLTNEWGVNLIQETAGGRRLTSSGEQYFLGVIPNLKQIAPQVFADVERDPTYIEISYATAFGGTVQSGTGNVVGSPLDLTGGDPTATSSNKTITVNTTGTIFIDLAGWTFGEIRNGTGTLVGSPIDLDPGTNTIEVTGAGTFIIDAEEISTITLYGGTVGGTALDLTDVAANFGMTRWFFSGIIWMIITIIVIAGVYKAETRGTSLNVGGSKVILLIFTIMIIGGTLLGLLHPLVSAILFIACGAFMGYILFFRSDSLHKGLMFMIWMFIITSIAGNILGGSMALTATRLTTNLSDTETRTINVASTEGFPDSGIIVIGDEIIGYPRKTDTTFARTSVLGVTTNPIMRGMHDTEASSHLAGATVSTREASFINASLDYKIARIADAAGFVDVVTLPLKLIDLFITFVVLPIGFLGTELAIFTYIWGVIGAGMIFGIGLQLVGGRRV